MTKTNNKSFLFSDIINSQKKYQKEDCDKMTEINCFSAVLYFWSKIKGKCAFKKAISNQKPKKNHQNDLNLIKKMNTEKE